MRINPHFPTPPLTRSIVVGGGRAPSLLPPHSLEQTLTGDLQHVSIANCGDWTGSNTEGRPGERSEGVSGHGLGNHGYTMYE